MLIKKIPDVSGLVTTTVLNTKIEEVVNIILDVSGLVMKTDYNAKISDIVVKYFNTFDDNKSTSKTKIKED